MTTTTDDHLLTLTETAEVLQISPQTLYRWRSHGEGPVGYRLLGGGVRYRRTDVDAWVQTQRDQRP